MTEEMKEGNEKPTKYREREREKWKGGGENKKGKKGENGENGAGEKGENLFGPR